MIEVGGGHKAPALAIKAGLERLYPGKLDIEVLDFMKAVGNTKLDLRHKASWNWMLNHPRAAYLGQTALDRAVPIQVTRWVQRQMLAPHVERAGRYVSERGYDLLVCTHFMPLQSLAIAKKKLGLKVTLVGVNTDPFDGHALWAEPGADELIVSSQQSKDFLVGKGVPAEKIRIFGYPLGLTFTDVAEDQDAMRHKLGLEMSRLTVLQSAGSEGLGGQLERFVAAVLAANLDVQYIVACGRNRTLLERLRQLAQRAGATTLIPQGFIGNMQEWIIASDLVLGKAGAASTFEPLALGRPIFHTSFVAPNEKRNLEFCLQHGVGAYVSRPETLVEVLRGFIGDHERLNTLSRKIKALKLGSGTLDIAAHLARRLPAV